MTRSTAAIYWAGTAAGHFEPMVLAYEPGEVFPAPDRADPAQRDPRPSTGRLSRSTRVGPRQVEVMATASRP